MDYSGIRVDGAGLRLTGVRHFHLEEILESGQCFRWQRLDEARYRGTVDGLVREISQQGDTLLFHGVDEAEFQRLWRGYFDLDRDYGAVKAVLTQDPVMARAVAFCPGMRVLRQPPWETLCSFIISANNNIARIRGIVERLCEGFGEPVAGGYAFPTPRRLASLTPEDLAPVRCGYRVAYLLDAGRMAATGELDLSAPYTLPLEEARASLRRVKGVGPKVADCVLLYGYSRAECVPEDVWIKRALGRLYPDGLPGFLAPVAGLGQQYLFHYVRNCPDALPASDQRRD